MIRLARFFGLAVAALILTLIFSAILFPYDRYRGAVEQALGEATGAQVRIARVGPGLGRAGVSLALHGVEIDFPDETALSIDEAQLRPALSRSWLRGDPALRLVLDGPAGGVNGTLWIGVQRGFVGSVENLDLQALGLERMLDGLDVGGRADADLDLRGNLDGLTGTLSFSARNGHLVLPFVGIPLPYQNADGSVQLREQDRLAIDAFRLEGPGLSLDATGTIGPAPVLERAPLDLQGHIEVSDATLRNLLGAAVGLGGDGSADFRVSGTLSNPTLQ